MAYRFGSSAYGTPSYGTAPSSYRPGSSYYSSAPRYGSHTASSTGYSQAQRPPPPAGSDVDLRDRWHSSSSAKLNSQSACRATRPATTSSSSSTLPKEPAGPTYGSYQPYGSTSQFTSQADGPTADRWNPNQPTFSRSADRLGGSGYATGGYSGGLGYARADTSNSYQYPSAYPSSYSSSASRIGAGNPSAPFLPTRSVYRPESAQPPPVTAPIEGRDSRVRADLLDKGANAASSSVKGGANAETPHEKTVDPAAERQRKRVEKKEQLAKAAEGIPADGEEPPITLDHSGRCHPTTEVVNATPFAVDNTGRCHPSPHRQRPEPAPERRLESRRAGGREAQPPPVPPSTQAATPPKLEPITEQTSGAASARAEDGGESTIASGGDPAETASGELEFCPGSPHKGSEHIYTNPNGKERVTVVSVHRDDIEPYYTIRMTDGREKQTIGSRLSPVIKQAPPLPTMELVEPTEAPTEGTGDTDGRLPLPAASGPTTRSCSEQELVHQPQLDTHPPPLAPPTLHQKLQSVHNNNPPSYYQQPMHSSMSSSRLSSRDSHVPSLRPNEAPLCLSDDRATRIEQLTAHLAHLKKQRSELLASSQ